MANKKKTVSKSVKKQGGVDGLCAALSKDGIDLIVNKIRSRTNLTAFNRKTRKQFSSAFIEVTESALKEFKEKAVEATQ